MDLLPIHEHQWQQFQQIMSNQRLPQALLMVAGSNCKVEPFIQRLIALKFCVNAGTEPCMQCKSCQLVQAHEHPDIHWIKPEKAGGSLKIEQIRQLQTQAYKTPKLANSQFFILTATERMNNSTSNALLKMLEEPSPTTYFILLAEHLSTLLPTIISRCQQWRFAYPREADDVLSLVNTYPQDSSQGLMAEKLPVVLEQLIALFSKASIPTQVATKMKDYEFKDLLWLLSLIHSQLIQLQMQKTQAKGDYSEPLNRLLGLVRVELLFQQLSKITSLQRKMSHNLNINQMLALEDLFIHLQQAIK